MLWNSFETNDETNNTGCWISVLYALILPGGAFVADDVKRPMETKDCDEI